MTHAFTTYDGVSDYAGFAIDAAARLTDAALTQIQKTHGTCKGCPQVATHEPYYVSSYKAVSESPKCDFAPEYCIPSHFWFWQLQSLINILYHIGEPIPTQNYIYNASGGNNMMQLIATFDILGYDDEAGCIRCYKDGVDPRACTPATQKENPDWPFSGARYISAGDGGKSLQPFDYMTFSGNVLESRGVKTFAARYEYLGDGSFNVYPFIRAYGAATAYPAESTPQVSFWRRIYSPSQWDDIKPSVPFYATKDNQNLAIADIIEVGELVYPERFIATIGGVNISQQLIDENRLFVNASNTTDIYMGATNWDGAAQEDLTALGDTLHLNYFKYDEDSGYICGQRVCKNCKICNHMASWGAGMVDAYSATFSAYCGEIENDPTAKDAFEEKCYKYHCSEFEELDGTANRDQLISFLNNVMFAQDLYMLQGAAGTHAYTLLTKKHPSIFQLAGHYKAESPTIASRSKRINLFNGLYGYLIDLELDEPVIECGGGIWNSEYDFDSETFSSGADGVAITTADALGVLGRWLNDSEYTTRHDPYRWADLLSTNTFNRLLPFSNLGGYAQNTLTPIAYSGVDETENCRGGEITTKVFATLKRGQTRAQSYQTLIESGSWNDDLEVDASGTWGAKVTINSGLPQGNHPVIVTGTVNNAERIDADTVKIQCELSPVLVGKDDGAGGVTVNAFNRGGNIVELPCFMKENNWYAYNQFATNQKAFNGHGFYCVLNNVGRKWAIKEALPCSGDALSYIPTTINHPKDFQVPYNSTGTNVPFALTAYRTAGNAKMTFACLAYCTTCDKETKWRLEWTHTGNYPIAYTLDNWVCNECAATVPYTAFYPDTPDITITGIPPGRHTIHDGAPAGEALDFELTADEWSLLPVYDENQEIDHYNIYFSPFVINHLEAAQGYKIRVYYVGGSVNGEEFVLPDHFPDFEIDDAFANAIEGANTYVKLYDSAGELVTLTKTDDADLRNWWDNGSDKRYQWYYYTAGGKHYIRFHFDFGATFGVYYYKTSRTTGMTSAEYYAAYVNGMPGLHKDHETYACKADTLTIVDHGEIGDVSTLEGLEFTVANNAVIHDDSAPDVYITDYAQDNWAQLNAADYKTFHALGVFLIKKTALAAFTSGFCLRIE